MERNLTVTPELLAAFGLPQDVQATQVTTGHINDTFLLQAPERRLVLQRINHFVFPSPPGHYGEHPGGSRSFCGRRSKSRGATRSGRPSPWCPRPRGRASTWTRRATTGGAPSHIENASSHETVGDPAMLEEAGRAFGRFQRLLCDYPAGTLHEIIPDFHNTPARYRQLQDAVAKNAAGRLGEVQAELDFAAAREKDCALLMDLLAQGELPLRVTHNDTKMSNVLMDDATGKAVCVIDLDTVMPGLCAFDFGDSIRAGASTAAEDEADLSKVHFDLDLFEAYTKGFLSAAGQALTEKELATLPDGAKLMTLEVGMRFLADYLNGDVYFRTAYPTHNLDRARNQFKLVEEMEEKRADMDRIVKKYC